jgi:23S rRNA (adenine2503-C2)-methyltransferase
VKLKKVYESSLNKLFVFKTEDDYQIESVFYRGDTLCVSTQVGCPVRCIFCASGKKGLLRNLSSEEIFQQYNLLKGTLPIRGIAIAGIGEPAVNSENVIKAINKFKSEGLRVTISTTGYPISGFKKLLDSNHDGITISIHALDEEKRKKLFKLHEPINEIINVLSKKLSTVSKRKRKRFQLGYLLLKEINNDYENLSKLRELASNLNLTVMLMMYNEVDEIPVKSISNQEYEEAFKFLREKNIRVTLSNRFRTDPLGGCGTLTIARD